MNNQLIKNIEKLLNANTGLRGTPATDTEIKNAENLLSVKFNSQYVDFIKIFGGAFGGLDIHAFNNGPLIGKATVTELTLKFRDAVKDSIPDELKESYVISDDGSGNPILMNSDGEIFIFFHETYEFEVLYSSLEELLNKSFP